MTTFMSLDIVIAAIILSIFALILVYRVYKGPHVADRVIAEDSIDILIGIIMILFGCYEERALYVDLGIVVALLGFISTILISKYLEGKL